MEKFKRPALCRLCEFPAGADGVQLSEVDIVKLSRWWEKALKTKFEDDELNGKYFCQFCVCDANYQGERKMSESCDWWTEHTTNNIYKIFFLQRDIIHPCAVRISPLVPSQDSTEDCPQKREPKKKHTPTTCIYCAETFDGRMYAYRHVLDSHRNTNPFSCNKCLLHFYSEAELKDHCKSFHPSQVKCHVCKKSVHPSLLKKHVSELHFSSERDTLECCGKHFTSQNALENHFRRVRVYEKAFCIYCKKYLSEKSNLPKHVRQWHADVAHKCNFVHCGKYFLSHKKKLKHETESHVSTYVQCPYCPNKISVTSLPRHIATLHHSLAVRCTFDNVCLTYFISETEKEEHIRKFHLGTKMMKRNGCKECGKSFFKRYCLLKHLKRNHKIEVKWCAIWGCQEYFKVESELENHYKEVHPNDGERGVFKCSECNYGSKSIQELKQHIVQEHTNRKFECVKCPQICKTKLALTRHMMRIHSLQKKMCLS